MISQLFHYIKYFYHKFQGLIFFTIGLMILASLLSYDPLDPSLNRASSNDVSNILGQFGASFSDICFQFFGVSSFLLAIAPITWAIRIFFQKKISVIYLRFISLIFAMISLGGMLHFFGVSENWPFYVSYGGYISDALAKILVSIITKYGAFLLCLFGFLILAFEALSINIRELKYVKDKIFYVLGKVTNYIIFIGKFFINLFRVIFGRTPVTIEHFKEEETTPVEIKKAPVIEVKQQKQRKPKQESFKIENNYEEPDAEFLKKETVKPKSSLSQSSLEQNSKVLSKVLQDFGVQGEITKIRPGPVVTLYEFEPSPGTKSSKVIGLADDIARSMSAVSARIAVIPGRNAIGIELPNDQREIVLLRSLVDSDEYQDEKVSLPIILGKDIGGDSIIADLAKMPHLLVAGTTGSGKSVAINTMILSLVYKLSPSECKFIMIDPKMLELSTYDNIPHLLTPVVTDPSKAVVALKWAVREMESRYKAMSNIGVRNISGYNKRIEEAIKNGEVLEKTVQTGFDPETGKPIMETLPLEMEKFPFIVVIVDEMADLMLVAGKDIESLIQRLAQMARAAGIHLIMATQRPSVDVITGVIKANFPTRISFQVTSKIDSRTILGEQGAEQLLGMGDMLYMAGGSRITRIHGPFVDDKEVNEIVKYLRSQGRPEFIQEVTEADDEDDSPVSNTGDELYDKAVAIVLRDKKASTSYIQRQLKIGYNRAANLIEKMEKEGVVSEANHVGKREILVGS